jgi:ribosomal subunit interface protein
MKTTTQFKNISGLEHIRNFVENSINQSLGKFEAWREFDAHVVMRTAKARSDSHKPVFESELVIEGKGLNRPIIVKKKNSDFYQAFNACILAAEKSLRRISKKRVTLRRHKSSLLHVSADQVA